VSGIAGIVRTDGAPADADLLRRMAACLAFRGPHGAGVRCVGATGLAHALLDTGDEAHPPTQPFTIDGERWIVADARIDGRAELVSALRAAGEAASEDAPAAELILRAHRAWGDESPSRLLGDFAFAIWDERARRLFCARDHFGVKPLYHAQIAGAFVFSNTLECVRLHPGVSDELNERAVGDFLLFGNNRDLSTTFFSAVRALPPAHALTVEDGRIRVSRYWSLPTEGEPVRGSVREHVERFTALLDRAVADRLPRGRASILLSGGRDSTAIAATARSMAPDVDLHAVTVGYESLFADPEPRFTRAAAEHLHIPLDLLAADGYGVLDGMRDGRLRRPEPLDDPLPSLAQELYRRAADHAPVALTGSGGDMALRESESRLARLLVEGKAARALWEGLVYARWHGRLPRPGFRTLRRRRSGEIGAPPPVPAWLDADFARRAGLRERMAEMGGAPPSPHPLRPEAHRLLSSPAVTRILEQYDPGVRRLPVHFRHPLLDVRLIHHLLYIPPSQWYNDKALLRIAMRGRLPPEIVRRPKATLAADPLLVRLRRDGAEWIGGAALSPAVERFVDRSRVPRLLGGSGGVADTDRLHENLRPLLLSLWLDAEAVR
jgi:asparagine synthase (glutamine-hydrolysing)